MFFLCHLELWLWACINCLQCKKQVLWLSVNGLKGFPKVIPGSPEEKGFVFLSHWTKAPPQECSLCRFWVWDTKIGSSGCWNLQMKKKKIPWAKYWSFFFYSFSLDSNKLKDLYRYFLKLFLQHVSGQLTISLYYAHLEHKL